MSERPGRSLSGILQTTGIMPVLSAAMSPPRFCRMAQWEKKARDLSSGSASLSASVNWN